MIAGVLDWPTLLPAYEVIDWVDPLLIPAVDWDEDVLATATGQALTAIFAGRHDRTRQLIAAFPPDWEDHFLTLSTQVYEDVWVTRAFDRAEALMTESIPSRRRRTCWSNFAATTSPAGPTKVEPTTSPTARPRSTHRVAIDDARLTGARGRAGHQPDDPRNVLDAIGDLPGAIEAMSESAQLAARWALACTATPPASPSAIC